MDFHCVEVLLGLPEFRVIQQVLGPSSWMCISNAETITSCVPNVAHAVPA